MGIEYHDVGTRVAPSLPGGYPVGSACSPLHFRFWIENLDAIEQAFGKDAALLAVHRTVDRVRSIFGRTSQVSGQGDEVLVETNGGFPAAPEPGEGAEFAGTIASTVLRMPIECGKFMLRPEVAGDLLAEDRVDPAGEGRESPVPSAMDRETEVSVVWDAVRSADGISPCLLYDCIVAGAEAGLDQAALSSRIDRIVRELTDSPHITIAIRLSDALLQQKHWSSSVVPFVEDHDVARRLVLDLGDAPEAACTADMRVLRGLGCQIALSGFGLGRSSFRQLLAARPDIVKVDGTLLRIARSSARCENAIRHLFGLAKSVAPEVIATGVDARDQSVMASGMGIDWQQGRFMGRPSVLRPWVL